MIKILTFSRASGIMDFVAVALIALVPLLIFSVYLVKQKRKVQLHRRLQIGLGIVLGLAILLFELDVRFGGWRHLAEPSPYYDSWVFPSLIFHLCFAVPTFVFWVLTLYTALKSFDGKGFSSIARRRHILLGRGAVIGLTMTSVTGWVFFWLAFIAV